MVMDTVHARIKEQQTLVLNTTWLRERFKETILNLY